MAGVAKSALMAIFFYLAKGDWLTFESVATGKDKSLECKIRWEKYNDEEFNRNYETY